MFKALGLFYMRNREHPKIKQIYQMWKNMMRRCYNLNLSNYKNYGGRGIKVCKRWHKFENFLSDEYEPYDAHRQLVGDNRKDLTIDRIDNDGDYKSGNIQYVSMKVQANNRRPIIIINN